MTLRSIALSISILLTLSAVPFPAFAVEDVSKCAEAKATASEFDIKTFCPQSDWPETYTADQAKQVVMTPIRAFISVFK